MIRPLELAIGLRHLRAKQRIRFVSFISLISVLGIALGVAALITVLSVMNGFERELRSRILGMASHATIAGFGGPLHDWREAANRALAHPSVLGAAPYVEGQAMLTAGGAVRGVLVRGIEPDAEHDVSDISRYMVKGGLDELEAGAFRIVVGSSLAARLGLDLEAGSPPSPRSRPRARPAWCRDTGASRWPASSKRATDSTTRPSPSCISKTREDSSGYGTG